MGSRSRSKSPAVERKNSRSRSKSAENARSRSRSRSQRSGSSGGKRRRSQSPSPAEIGHRLHLADIGTRPDKQTIEKEFNKFGKILEVWVAENPPCFAFIVFKEKEDAEDALEEMNGQVLFGQRIRVSWAKPRNKGGRRMTQSFDNGMRCYSCGMRGHFSRDCSDYWRSRGRRSYGGGYSGGGGGGGGYYGGGGGGGGGGYRGSRGRYRSRSRERYARKSRSRSRSPKSRSASPSAKKRATKERSRSRSVSN